MNMKPCSFSCKTSIRSSSTLDLPIKQYWALAKGIANAILHPATSLAYKYLQQVIAEDDEWRMLEHVLQKIAPHLGGKAEDLQK